MRSGVLRTFQWDRVYKAKWCASRLRLAFCTCTLCAIMLHHVVWGAKLQLNSPASKALLTCSSFQSQRLVLAVFSAILIVLVRCPCISLQLVLGCPPLILAYVLRFFFSPLVGGDNSKRQSPHFSECSLRSRIAKRTA